MDASETRRGQVCWYLRPEVGLIAINDACMLESAIYILLKKHLKGHPSYIEMVELFHEVSFQTEIGQSCDLLVEGQALEDYQPDKYNFIVQFKTAFYSSYHPFPRRKLRSQVDIGCRRLLSADHSCTTIHREGVVSKPAGCEEDQSRHGRILPSVR